MGSSLALGMASMLVLLALLLDLDLEVRMALGLVMDLGQTTVMDLELVLLVTLLGLVMALMTD